MNTKDKSNDRESETVDVKVKFLGILPKFSDNKRVVEITLPANPGAAVEQIIAKFGLPWKDNLEKITRIFVNNQHLATSIKNGVSLKNGDVIAFIQLSGGG